MKYPIKRFAYFFGLYLLVGVEAFLAIHVGRVLRSSQLGDFTLILLVAIFMIGLLGLLFGLYKFGIMVKRKMQLDKVKLELLLSVLFIGGGVSFLLMSGEKLLKFLVR
jgi:hypothetical protein